LLASNARYATEQFWFKPGLVSKLALSVVLVGATIYFVAQTWRLGGEAHWLAVAERQPVLSPEWTAALEKAFACEPKNFQTAYDLGESLRTQSLDGGDQATARAEKALEWFALASGLNPQDGYSFLRIGMCLDWLGRHAEAEPFYQQAEARDPNGYFMVANIGWHYVETGDYAAAREWFIRSLQLSSKDNVIARNYLAICESRLVARASGQRQLPFGY
jgi:tetratricopeptide (TPR) repeat protein